MRNLKRALSLALASVMLLGMMTVGASAVSVGDFTDADKISNKEAAAITTEIGIFSGYGDGSFGAENVVTRAEMATIICKMLYGADINADQFKQNQVFTDVPDWAAGYVNMCAALGIVSGYGDGTFRPDQNVTTVEAATMLVKALGYFKNDKEYGNDWKLAVTAKATSLKVYDGIALNVDDGLTRDDTSVLVFNTLTKAVPVMYNEAFDTYYTDSTAWTSGVKFDYKDTLAYKNFRLVYDDSTGNSDNYGRPVTVWGTISSTATITTDNDGNINSVTIPAANEIISVANEPVASYVASTKVGTISSALSKYTFELGANNKSFKNVKVTVDGNTYGSGASLASLLPANYNGTDKYDLVKALTANGTQVTIYADKYGNLTDIVVVNTYLAEVKRAASDDDGRYITLSVYGGPSLDSEKFYTADFAEDDLVLVTTYVNDEGDQVIASVNAPQTVEGEITAMASDYVRLDGTKYEFAAQKTADANDGDDFTISDYALYLDQYGYIVGYKLTGDTSNDYLYLKSGVAKLAGGNYQAVVVLPDGTSQTVTVSRLNDATPTENGLVAGAYEFSVRDDGTYSLTSNVSKSAGTEIENGKASINSSYVVNSNTKFVVIDDDTYTAYVGYNAIPDIEDAASIRVIDHNGDNVYDVVFVVLDDNSSISTSSSTAFFIADSGKKETFKANGVNYVTFTKVYTQDGATSITVEENVAKNLGNGLYFAKSVNDKGYVTKVESSDEDQFTTAELKAYKATTAANGTLALDNGKAYVITGDTLFLVVDKDKNVKAGTYKDIVVYDSDKKNTDASYVYVTKTVDDKGAIATIVTVIDPKAY